jgi:16S rRNA (adenine1518-N6/adenine1519-N6)-dimethyltransferase
VGSERRRAPPIRKSLGQHFLHDRAFLARIVDAVAPAPQETVVEIGAGRGALTDLLRDRAGRVVAIEYDRMLAALLRERYAEDERVSIVEADVLEVDLSSAAGGAFALVGNVPYYITTPILFHALRPPRADRAVFLVQREVAERMTANPGSQEFGALTVNLQSLARTELLFRVPAGAFRPPPKVESAVVRVTPLAEPLVRSGDEGAFREMVQGIFGFRRKQMRRVLRELSGLTPSQAEDVLRAAHIDADTRPETIAPIQFVELFERLRAVSA